MTILISDRSARTSVLLAAAMLMSVKSPVAAAAEGKPLVLSTVERFDVDAAPWALDYDERRTAVSYGPPKRGKKGKVLRW